MCRPVLPLHLSQFHVGLAHQPVRFVARTVLLEVVGQQVGVHLDLQQRDARPLCFVDVLGGLGIKLEGGEDHNLRSRLELHGLFQGHRHLPLFQGSELRANDTTTVAEWLIAGRRRLVAFRC